MRKSSAATTQILIDGPLDLEATLYSGQAFRWVRAGPSAHEGFVQNVPVRVSHADAELLVEGGPVSVDALRHYFRLDPSHDRFLRDVPRDPSLSQALQRFAGLRLLRQDPWEMMVSFVISQNSNEPKIRKTIEALCRLAGEPVPFRDDVRFRFPSPSALLRLDAAQLRSTGMGYRAKYVQAVASAVARQGLRPARLVTMTYEDAFERLLQIDGIGPKVADCILLYGCDHQVAFPSDVWVRRFLKETYMRRQQNPSHAKIQAFAQRHFGPHAGYAQHYLFHYRRGVGTLASNRS